MSQALSKRRVPVGSNCAEHDGGIGHDDHRINALRLDQRRIDRAGDEVEPGK